MLVLAGCVCLVLEAVYDAYRHVRYGDERYPEERER